jgi:hypothetical protein
MKVKFGSPRTLIAVSGQDLPGIHGSFCRFSGSSPGHPAFEPGFAGAIMGARSGNGVSGLCREA